MENLKDELYTVINSTFLKKLGDNVSTMAELLLFDNLDGTIKKTDPHDFFSNNLIKLGSDILVICRNGVLKYMMDCNRPMNLRSGEFAYLKEGEIIDFLEADNDCKIILISLPHNIGMISIRDKSASYNSSVIEPPPEQLNELCTIYRMMKKKMDTSSCGLREEIVYSYLMVMLSLLYEAINNSDNMLLRGRLAVADRNMELYTKFVKSVKNNYAAHRDVAFYASDICISPGHLARIVKKVSGKRVSEWISDYVVLEAKVMLRLQELAIYQISEMLNFPNPSFFSKYFRCKEGMSPTEYRRRVT